MEQFASELLQQLPAALFAGLSTAWGLKGVVAEQGLKLVFLPFHEFSVTSCLVAIGWTVILWKNKGLVLSGLSHLLDIGGWLMRVVKLDNR